MKGFVYILKDEQGVFYVGSTDKPDRRIIQHQKGYTQTTSRMENVQLVLLQECESLKVARQVERKVKSLKRKDYIEKMVRDGHIKLTEK